MTDWDSEEMQEKRRQARAKADARLLQTIALLSLFVLPPLVAWGSKSNMAAAITIFVCIGFNLWLNNRSQRP